jgi:hypothetical protein
MKRIFTLFLAAAFVVLAPTQASAAELVPEPRIPLSTANWTHLEATSLQPAEAQMRRLPRWLRRMLRGQGGRGNRGGRRGGRGRG